MGQAADAIKGLEVKLAEVQKQVADAVTQISGLQTQLADAQKSALDDADKAAIASAQAILNPAPISTPVAPATPAQ